MACSDEACISNNSGSYLLIIVGWDTMVRQRYCLTYWITIRDGNGTPSWHLYTETWTIDDDNPRTFVRTWTLDNHNDCCSWLNPRLSNGILTLG